MVTQSLQGAVTILSVGSTLDGEEGGELLEQTDAIPRVGRTQLVVDLNACPLVDSAGCESLLDVYDAVNDRDGAVLLAGASPLVSDIFLATGVDRFFESFDGVNEAVRSFTR